MPTFARMELVVRNMVCDRCIAAVGDVLKTLGLPVGRIALGEVRLQSDATAGELDALQQALQHAGFELVTAPEARIVARIKAAVVARVHHATTPDHRTKLSEHLAALLHQDYSGLSALFAQVEGITIEHYFLLQRMERVKELIKYGELSMSEVAFRTGFSSAAHMSTQFKQFTGMTPSAFKKTGRRQPLDRVG